MSGRRFSEAGRRALELTFWPLTPCRAFVSHFCVGAGQGIGSVKTYSVLFGERGKAREWPPVLRHLLPTSNKGTWLCGHCIWTLTATLWLMGVMFCLQDLEWNSEMLVSLCWGVKPSRPKSYGFAGLATWPQEPWILAVEGRNTKDVRWSERAWGGGGGRKRMWIYMCACLEEISEKVKHPNNKNCSFWWKCVLSVLHISLYCLHFYSRHVLIF